MLIGESEGIVSEADADRFLFIAARQFMINPLWLAQA